MLLFWNLVVLPIGLTARFGLLVSMVDSTLLNNEVSFFTSFIAKLRQSFSCIMPRSSISAFVQATS